MTTTMKATTTIKDFPIPRPVEQHPLVVRQAERRGELEAGLTRVRAQHAALVAERTVLEQAQHEERVAQLLGDPRRPDAPSDDRLQALTATIDEAARAIAAGEDALERQQAIAAGVRDQAWRDVQQETAAALEAIVSDMAPHIDELVALNHHIEQLWHLGALPFGVSIAPLGHLRQWLNYVRAQTGGR